MAVLALIAGLGLSACSTAAQVQVLQGQSMGSGWTVRYVGNAESAAGVQAGVQQRLDRVDAQMSTWKPQSDLSRYNQAAAESWVEVPVDLYQVIAAALKLAAETGGAYDPSVGPLVDLWGFGPSPARRAPPDAATIAEMRARTGWQRIQLDPIAHRVWQPGGSRIDLSSIAPGFAVDRIAQFLESQGHHDYLIEVGGELRGQGSKPDGTPWQVAIQRPLDTDRADGGIDAQHVLGLTNAALGSSGDYRHFFEDGGRRYAHRIDPRTGYPLDNKVASVTVMSANCQDADPLATALSVLGVEQGLAFAEKRGIAVLYILRTANGF
ncbi:MAG: FAD:protein FMN transferase, partial [Rhodanobacteraceae bacterium]|nr:FAD:protein FMN transferase [Rhodanobacteraceae bacterium]